MNPITSLDELQSAIQALPPVAPGKVRVFRGQTKNYDKIQPAAYRTHLASRAAWSIYSRFLLADTDRQPGIRQLASEELQIQAVWLEALAQHYGSGSSYLDVSHSVESAAWFALHHGKTVTEDVPSLAAPESLPQSVEELSWLEYSQAVDPGCIYVFDVVEWDPRDLVPPPLALVDLSHAPEVLRTPRMLAQLGCLIRAEGSEHDDLRGHLICEPLPVAWPMTGSAYVQQRVEEMFPSPAVDHWFRRFLSMPLVPDTGPKGELLFKRSLPVTLYRGETPEYNAAVRDTRWSLDPPLVHQVTWQKPSPDAPKEHLFEEFKTATPIVVEAPLMRIFPSASSTLWNHELLISDLPDSAMPSNEGKENGEIRNEAVDLTNVLFQFSALEEIWDRDVPLKKPNWLTRALWLSRRQDAWTGTLVMQNFPAARLEIQPAVTFRFEPGKRRLMYKKVDGEEEWAELSTLPELAKPVFVALYLLRALTPTWKAEATPMRYVEPSEGPGLRYYWVSIFANAAGLVRMPASAGNADWFALRNKFNDPFTTATATSSSVKLDTEAEFADFPRSYFQQIIEANKSGFALP